MIHSIRPLLISLVILMLAACGSDGEQSDSSNPRLTVFAASSLTDAFEELATAFEEQQGDVEVRLNFASSSTLATQIIEGAPADVFASANVAQMMRVEETTRNQPVIFARNRLVVVTPSEGNVQSLEDLADDNIRVVLAAPNVPIREYADLAIENLAQEYGDDFAAAVFANLVSEEENVRAVLLRIDLGEADAGFVYASDITPDIEVAQIPIPDAANVMAEYPIVATSETTLALQFIDFISSAEGQAILEKWGFIPVG